MKDLTHFERSRLQQIADGEWMMIHSDTFISERDRFLMKERAFMIDRDLHAAAKTLNVKRTIEQPELL